MQKYENDSMDEDVYDEEQYNRQLEEEAENRRTKRRQFAKHRRLMLRCNILLVFEIIVLIVLVAALVLNVR